MNLRLQKFLNILSQWFNKESKSLKKIPITFDESEKIIRSIYSPINIHKTQGTLRPNAFRTPPDKDEVSVNRLDYTNPFFCKKISKENQIIGERNYFGFALLFKKQIDLANCKIEHTPINKPKEKSNPFHSDIKIGYIPKKGEELPSEISKKISDLTKMARFYKDPNPSAMEWTGQELI